MIYEWALVLASYVFIICHDWRYGPIIFAYSLIVFLLGKYIYKSRHGKIITAIGIAISIMQIALCRYCNSPIVPIGISFYSFSGISYLVDVYRSKKAPNGSLLDVLLYLSFFPKLTAGPIVRYDNFVASIKKQHHLTRMGLSEGIQILTIGLFKKMVIADNLSVFVNDVYGAPLAFQRWTVLLAIFSYSFQIYFDFSGYSDIAIGLSKMLGFDFGPNFDLPYASRSPAEFWKRWHISLSSWLQDYVYIPLGGNRKGIIRTCLNLLLTMIIGGIWHGPTMNFVVWGALNGIALVAHRIFGEKEKHKSSAGSMVLTFIFISFTWIFFRASSIESALQVINCLFENGNGLTQPYIWSFVAFAIVILEICYSVRTDAYKQNIHYKYPLLNLNKFWHLALYFTFIGLIIILANLGDTAFIYGRF